MSQNYRVYWGNVKRTILCVEIADDWDWKVIHEVDQRVHAMLDRVNHRVACIVSLQNQTVPKGALSHVQTLMRRTHPNEFLKVFVGMGMLLPRLVSVVGQIYNLNDEACRIRFKATIEEAFAEIEREIAVPQCEMA